MIFRTLEFCIVLSTFAGCSIYLANFALPPGDKSRQQDNELSPLHLFGHYLFPEYARTARVATCLCFPRLVSLINRSALACFIWIVHTHPSWVKQMATHWAEHFSPCDCALGCSCAFFCRGALIRRNFRMLSRTLIPSTMRSCPRYCSRRSCNKKKSTNRLPPILQPK